MKKVSTIFVLLILTFLIVGCNSNNKNNIGAANNNDLDISSEDESGEYFEKVNNIYKLSDDIFNIEIQPTKPSEIKYGVTEVESDGAKFILEVAVVENMRVLKINDEIFEFTYGNQSGIPDSFFLVDLDPNDEFMELQIRVAMIPSIFQIYRLKSNGLELLYGAEYDSTIENEQLIQIKDKWIISHYAMLPGLVSSEEFIQSFHIYESGEFKHIEKLLNGEELYENGNFNQNILNHVFETGYGDVMPTGYLDDELTQKIKLDFGTKFKILNISPFGNALDIVIVEDLPDLPSGTIIYQTSIFDYER